jgi:Na+/H+ antiporter NhaD/arsenite permease-like protein
LWTFGLFWPWLCVNLTLLVVFNLLDQFVLAREERERPGAQLEEVQQVSEALGIEGAGNFVWLGGVLVVILTIGSFGKSHISPNEDVLAFLQLAGMLFMAALSMATTRREIRMANGFTWEPIIEVAVVFVGIFVTMIPALKLLEARGAEFGVNSAWQFFWATGILSSFLDNAPTYLAFTSLAVGIVNEANPGAGLSAQALGGLLAYPDGARYLTAISCGAVFMGANTYIGNGPNFMVKSIAERAGVRMPSFLGYMAWSSVILLPLFLAVTLVFFR